MHLSFDLGGPPDGITGEVVGAPCDAFAATSGCLRGLLKIVSAPRVSLVGFLALSSSFDSSHYFSCTYTGELQCSRPLFTSPSGVRCVVAQRFEIQAIQSENLRGDVSFRVGSRMILKPSRP